MAVKFIFLYVFWTDLPVLAILGTLSVGAWRGLSNLTVLHLDHNQFHGTKCCDNPLSHVAILYLV